MAAQLKLLRPEMATLYMSGYTDDVVSDNGAKDEGAAYLQKPFTSETLAHMVRETLRPARTSAAILVVDDDAAVRSLFHKILSAEGHRVTEAPDGDKALDAFRTGEFDLVITDLVMPGKEGIETIRAIRKLHPNVKIVAMSGAFGGEYLKIATLLGAQSVLPKPISKEALLETVRQLTKQG
jgi:CheY-like chemotaxis protein